MPTNYLSKLTLPVNVLGTVTNVEYTLKDAEAREMIEDIGHALYWIGVTTTELTDGATTNPITVNGESVTAKLGGMASYNGSEFVWNGTAWQELGKNNFGALAFKSNASTTYTPAGQVNITEAADTTTEVVPFGSAGTLPAAGTAVDVVTASGARTAAFVGTEATITVS